MTINTNTQETKTCIACGATLVVYIDDFKPLWICPRPTRECINGRKAEQLHVVCMSHLRCGRTARQAD